jgi:hypothetical protein
MFPQAIEFAVPANPSNDRPTTTEVLRELDLPEYMLVSGGECLSNNI